jgi:hypothetical protein
MAQMHPDQLYALVQEQQHDLLQEATQLRLVKSYALWQNQRNRMPIVYWAGAQLMSLGLRWQGYNSYVQPIVICGETICQGLTSPPLGDGDGCVSQV